jgi:hypothetical protein
MYHCGGGLLIVMEAMSMSDEKVYGKSLYPLLKWAMTLKVLKKKKSIWKTKINEEEKKRRRKRRKRRNKGFYIKKRNVNL